jgi:hypothetical protein
MILNACIKIKAWVDGWSSGDSSLVLSQVRVFGDDSAKLNRTELRTASCQTSGLPQYSVRRRRRAAPCLMWTADQYFARDGIITICM